MTMPEDTRRNFLKAGASVFGASWLAINMPLIVSASETAVKNQESAASFVNISVLEAVEIGAFVDQIIPADETPGATEIGVVYFVDAALGGFMANMAPVIRQGFEELQQKTQSAHPSISRFSELSFSQQTDMLKLIEDTPFFETLYFATLCGMFCLPSHGGNRDYAGWNLIGFDHQHVWQPPFGYYDAADHGQADKQGEDSEQV